MTAGFRTISLFYEGISVCL